MRTPTEDAELVALSNALTRHCENECGRFATVVVEWHWSSGHLFCDTCAAVRLREGPHDGQVRDLPQAKLARRFDVLLRGEG